MPFGYPLFVELAGRRCVVIGADAVREGKVEALREAGATDIAVLERGWRPEDLNGAFLCVASSPDAAERDRIAKEARARGVLVNVMDDIPNCDWAAPAVLRRGGLAIAVSTGGRSPALARRLREELAERFGDEWGEIVEVLREVREATNRSLPDLSERSRRWRRALDLEEAEGLARAGRLGELRTRLIDRLTSAEVRA